MKKAVLGLILLLFVIYGGTDLFGSEWDIALLDTARDIDYLTEEEKNVILEMNKVRSNPVLYAEMYISPRLQWFGGPLGNDYYQRPGETVYIRQTGGRAAVVTTINTLMRLQARPPLSPSRGISLAARDHTLDIGPRGMTGHTGSDRSSLTHRLRRYGRWEGGASETISYGYNIAREIVIQLLISQGHRDVLMNGNHRYTGVSIGDHRIHNYMCTIKFANRFTEN